MHIFTLVILFWVTRMSLHALFRIQGFLWLVGSHTSDATLNNNRAAVHNQFLRAKRAAGHTLCKCVTQWCGVMSQSHWIKVRITDELLLVRTWTFFLIFKIISMSKKGTTLQQANKKEKNDHCLISQTLQLTDCFLIESSSRTYVRLH